MSWLDQAITLDSLFANTKFFDDMIDRSLALVVRWSDGGVYLRRPEASFSPAETDMLIKWLDQNNPEAQLGVIPADMEVAETILYSELAWVQGFVQDSTTRFAQPLKFQGYSRAHNFEQLLTHYWLQKPEEVKKLIWSFSIKVLWKTTREIEVGPENYDIALFIYWASENQDTFRLGQENYYDTWSYFTHEVAEEAFLNSRTDNQVIRDLLFEEGSAVITIKKP